MNNILEDLKGYFAVNQNVYIWGAGLMGRSFYTMISRHGLSENVKGFIDINTSTIGKSFAGKKIFAPTELKNNTSIIIAVAKDSASIKEFLLENNLEVNFFDLNNYQELGHWSIEIVGACNLRCPSCPRGNFTQPEGKKFMKYEAVIDTVNHIFKIDPSTSYIALYNWGDTFLYKNLSKLLEELSKLDIYIATSSNLSMPKPDLETLVKNLRKGELRISLSGFTQDIYEYSHEGGNIEIVKKNMVLLKNLIEKYNNYDLQVKVVYHKYKHNIHEVELMKKFSEDLGFSFDPINAILFPVEHILDYLDFGIAKSEKFNKMANNLLMPLNELLKDSARSNTCKFWKQNDIDVDGGVTLCCITFDRNINTVANSIFEIDNLDSLLKKKMSNPLCGKCMNRKVDRFVWGDLWVEKKN
jgi:MoaA/NifB/PqqE/SkfB family radical SAM enzyme